MIYISAITSHHKYHLSITNHHKNHLSFTVNTCLITCHHKYHRPANHLSFNAITNITCQCKVIANIIVRSVTIHCQHLSITCHRKYHRPRSVICHSLSEPVNHLSSQISPANHSCQHISNTDAPTFFPTVHYVCKLNI